jgi:hypothetical protein
MLLKGIFDIKQTHIYGVVVCLAMKWLKPETV